MENHICRYCKTQIRPIDKFISLESGIKPTMSYHKDCFKESQDNEYYGRTSNKVKFWRIGHEQKYAAGMFGCGVAE